MLSNLWAWITGAPAAIAAAEGAAPHEAVTLIDAIFVPIERRSAGHPFALQAEIYLQHLVDVHGEPFLAEVESAALTFLASKGVLLPAPTPPAPPAATPSTEPH